MAEQPQYQQEDEDINTSLISLLECPVCLNYMIPPITQCLNGHNVCSKCSPELTQCPVCREYLQGSSSRNLFAEKMTEKGKFPCKNADNGCNQIMRLAEMQSHNPICPFRLYECLVMKPNCAWKGRRNNLFEHVSSIHEGRAWDTEVVNFKCPDSFGTTTFSTNAIITAYGEVFFVSLDWDVDSGKLFGTVQYIGQKDKASTYKYKFEFRNETDKVKHQHAVKCETDNANNIYDSGECVCIETKLAKRFMMNDKLQFRLTIIKKF